MKRTLASMIAKEYAETGVVPYCPQCGSKNVTTKGYVYGKRESVTVTCSKCGEIGHFDGMEGLNANAKDVTNLDKENRETA